MLVLILLKFERFFVAQGKMLTKEVQIQSAQIKGSKIKDSSQI